MSEYDKTFFEGQKEGSRRSAQRVVPVVRDIVRPSSVVDVGCGVGTWLAAWREAGVTDVHGYDGDYVDRSMLQIPQEQFTAADLSKPLNAGRTFDLAQSLEVGEHLPHTASESFVESLTSLAPVVLFSAAIPLQGGTHHINEQWPAYWVERFASRGYVVVNALRAKFWNDDAVQPWYRQNMLFFVDESKLANYPQLAEARRTTDEANLNVVHPWFLAHRNEMPVGPPIRILKRGTRLALAGVKRRLRGGG